MYDGVGYSPPPPKIMCLQLLGKIIGKFRSKVKGWKSWIYTIKVDESKILLICESHYIKNRLYLNMKEMLLFAVHIYLLFLLLNSFESAGGKYHSRILKTCGLNLHPFIIDCNLYLKGDDNFNNRILHLLWFLLAASPSEKYLTVFIPHQIRHRGMYGVTTVVEISQSSRGFHTDHIHTENKCENKSSILWGYKDNNY